MQKIVTKHRKALREIFEKRLKQKLIKNQKTTDYQNAIQHGAQFFTFSLPGGARTSDSRQLRHWC